MYCSRWMLSTLLLVVACCLPLAAYEGEDEVEQLQSGGAMVTTSDMARQSVTFFYAGYFYSERREARFLPEHQGGIGFNNYHNKNMSTGTDISLVYLRSGDQLFLFTYEALSLDFAFFLNLHLPVHRIISLTASLGWFVGVTVGVKDERLNKFRWGTSLQRQSVGSFQTGPVFKAGIEIGKQTRNSVFIPIGVTGRYYFYDGFRLGMYTGIGVRF